MRTVFYSPGTLLLLSCIVAITILAVVFSSRASAPAGPLSNCSVRCPPSTNRTAIIDSVKTEKGWSLHRVATIPKLTSLSVFPDATQVTSSQYGRLTLLRDNKAALLGDLRKDVSQDGGERGLLDVQPYAGKVWVSYTNRSGDSRIGWYKTTGTGLQRRLTGSFTTVISQDQPEANHNGGDLLVTPDNQLWTFFGDGGGGGDKHGLNGNAQNPNTRLGKLLQIAPGPVRILAKGFRNPWRNAISKQGLFAVTDVGQEKWEELNIVNTSSVLGANFGWRAWEGPHKFDKAQSPKNTIKPATAYRHSRGRCSITGAAFLTGRKWGGREGSILYGDFCSGEVWRTVPNSKHTTVKLNIKVPANSDFVSIGSSTYALSQSAKAVYRLDYKK